MIEYLTKYTPIGTSELLGHLLNDYVFLLKIKPPRKRKRGDFRVLPNGRYQITINNNLSKEQFLITLVHEIAHLKTYLEYKHKVLAHGVEWKKNFKELMLPFLKPEFFSAEVYPLLVKHMSNPKATTDSDIKLSLALSENKQSLEKKFIFELKHGDVFEIDDKEFELRNKRRTRYVCCHLKTKREFLIHQNAQVKLLKTAT